MATFTLAQAQLLGLNDLQSGIAETIRTVGPAIGQLPFIRVSGNAFAYLRELTGVDGQIVAADGTITDSSALTSTPKTVALSAISGQSDIPNSQLRQEIGQNAGNGLRSIHLAAASKGVGREFSNRMINGTVAANGWDGLRTLFTSDAAFAGQVVDAANAAFSLDLIDAASALVTNQGPRILMGNAKAEAKFKAAMRAAGGVTSVELNGVFFNSYDGMAFIRNDFIANDFVGGTAGNQSDIYVVTFGDGVDGGVVGLTSAVGDLFNLTEFPALEMKDATRLRVIMDGAMVVRSPFAISQLKNVTV